MEINWEEIWQSFVNGCVDLAWRLVKALIILIVGFIIIQIVSKVFFREKTNLKETRKRMNPTIKNFLKSVIKAILWCIIIVSVICALGVEVASIITVLAAAGAAIALALQGSLSNVASGFLLIILHPFVIGDFVTIAGNDGFVLDIGVCATTLRTTDNKHVIIPNSIVTGNSVINFSREETRRVDIDLAVAYGSNPEKVKACVMDIIRAHPNVILDDETKQPFVRLTGMEDSSLKITARAWVKSADYWPVRFDLLEQCYNAFNKKRIQIPFPQLDIHVKDRK
ncbi:MAG: mechanosensitive ion channel [Clostridia bacterium]|nr:mechanosensitive ion channel [Clostridia bacterium]